ncbi:MAG: hypothetical protein ACM3JJ_06130 [Hyphomicrobiales bacterium]
MMNRWMETRDYAKAVLMGLLGSLFLAIVMLAWQQSGLSPFPEALPLAFVRSIFGPTTELGVGIFLHTVWITFWTVMFVVIYRRRTFADACVLALWLWLTALFVFCPLAGWGFYGTRVSPLVPLAMLVPHVLFAVSAWGLARWLIPRGSLRPLPASTA